ncbi:MAG: MmgE/PrpD family protein [Conexibacter sp.]
MSDHSSAARIAAFAVGLRPADVPAPVRAAAALHVLDTLGCGLAAVGTGAGAPFAATAAAEGDGGACSVLGLRGERGVETAAFANAAQCHALDFDDTHGDAICHVSTVVAPAALALAQAEGRSGAELLTAVVAGSEAIVRIGAVAAPAYMRTGFHHTSVCGAFGATVAAARLLGLDAERMAHALGICGSLASGSLAFLDDGSTAKAVNAGAAARAGVLAARLAAHGADGPAAIFEGRFGAFASFFRLDDPPADWLDDLGTRWETPRTAFKPYPACHFIHSSLDGARAAAEQLGVLGAPERVTAVELELPEPALPLVCEPRAAKVRPRTPYEGKFSVQYSVAAMLVHGAVGVASYEPAAIADERTLALAARVHHRAGAFATFPAAFPARVTVRTAEDAVTIEVPHQRGGAEAPLSADEVVGKFRANAALALAEPDVLELEQLLNGLERLDDLRAVGALLARASAREPTEVAA